MADYHDYLVKVALLGDPGVGKTSMLSRFISDKFKIDQKPSLGVDYKIKIIPVQDRNFKLHIWDIPGQERFKSEIQAYFKQAGGVIVAFSVTDPNSFFNLKKWLKIVHENAAPNAQIYLVGTKSGEEGEARTVSKWQAEALAQAFSMKYVEVSVKLDSSKVNTLFLKLGTDIKVKVIDADVQPQNAYNVPKIEEYFAQLGNNSKSLMEKPPHMVQQQLQQQLSYDFLVKVLLIGDTRVGKSSILNKFVNNTHNSVYTPTVGVDFKVKTVQVEDKKVRLYVWDTAGQNRLSIGQQSYYYGAIGVVLTYAVDDRVSFENIEAWLKQVSEYAAPNTVKFLVGNKIDSKLDRVVSKEEGIALASKYGMHFAEVSAREGVGIEEFFHKLSQQIKYAVLECSKRDSESMSKSTKSESGVKQFQQQQQQQEGRTSIHTHLSADSRQIQYDYLVKVVVLGEAKVGKSNLLNRYVNKTFDSDYKATFGVDFKLKTIKVENKKLKLHLWDIAGQERLSTASEAQFRGAIAFIVVYSVDDPTTFENLSKWIKQIEQCTSVVKYLVGNKLDRDRRVDREQGQALAMENQMRFCEVSAKQDLGVNELFESLGADILQLIQFQEDPAKWKLEKQKTEKKLAQKQKLEQQQQMLDKENLEKMQARKTLNLSNMYQSRFVI